MTIPNDIFVSDIIYTAVVLGIALVASVAFNKAVAILSHRFNAHALRGRFGRQFVRYSIFIVALLIILNRFGFDTNSILAVLGTLFGLVAIGFVAVWSVLSNFLCTLVIHAFKPFRPGDRVSLSGEDTSGTVREITLVFTTIEGADGEIAHVPNNAFFQKTFKVRPSSGR